jgi:hypothetical protein
VRPWNRGLGWLKSGSGHGTLSGLGSQVLGCLVLILATECTEIFSLRAVTLPSSIKFADLPAKLYFFIDLLPAES